MKAKLDNKSFEETYISYYSRMSRFAQSYAISEEDAENIVQDIFIDIWEKKLDLTKISNVGGYLFLSLKNKCIDYIRHKKIENRTISELKKENEILLKLSLDSLEALDEKTLTEPDIETLIQHAIDKLPEKCKEIFVMNKLQGKKQKVIASELNISINTVESQMSIAYKKLKEELKDYFHVFIFFI